jgi:predicted nucleic acid-binding protein
VAANVIVDAAFLVSLLNRREANHAWAAGQSRHLPFPWKTCEAALSETFHILSVKDAGEEIEAIIRLMAKYEDVPMSFADACLVRMTEVLRDSVLVTLDSHFRIYRRHGNKTIHCVMPN